MALEIDYFRHPGFVLGCGQSGLLLQHSAVTSFNPRPPPGVVMTRPSLEKKVDDFDDLMIMVSSDELFPRYLARSLSPNRQKTPTRPTR